MDSNSKIYSDKINKLIYDTLSLRKSILLPEIGVVGVVCIGSLKNKPTKTNDFPHYNIVLTNDNCDVECDVDLSAELSKFGEFTDGEKSQLIANWLLSVRVKNSVYIPNCFILASDKTIFIYPLLNLQLNPFYNKKHSNKKGEDKINIVIGLILFVIIIVSFL